MLRTTLRTSCALLFCAFGMAAVGCDDGPTPGSPTSPANPSDPGGTNPTTTPASDFEVTECHTACDQLKFFGCADASVLATCYSGCDEASHDQATLFAGCVRTDQCDPACLPYLTKESTPGPVNENSSGGGDSSASGGGGSGGTPSGNTGAPVEAQCVELCASLEQGGCLDVSMRSLCQSTCLAATDVQRATFAACGMAHGDVCADTCLAGLGFAPPSNHASAFEVSVCQTTCDTMLTFECIGASEQSACRSLCAEASSASVKTFIGCGDGICSDRSCLDVFEDAN